MEKKHTYETAIRRLEEIVSALESAEPGLDEIGGLVKEATGLLDFCKTKLEKSEADIQKLLADGEK